MATLMRQIIQSNPPIVDLNMNMFSKDSDNNDKIGELVLESLLNSSIDTITDLNFGWNLSWFKPCTKEQTWS